MGATSEWDDEDITRRVSAKFESVGVSPSHLANDWTLDSDGWLRATAVIKMTPEEAAEIINGSEGDG